MLPVAVVTCLHYYKHIYVDIYTHTHINKHVIYYSLYSTWVVFKEWWLSTEHFEDRVEFSELIY